MAKGSSTASPPPPGIDRVRALLGEAEATYRAHELALWALAMQRRRGEISDDATGGALIASADAELRAREIRDPARMVAALLPGRW